MMKKAQGQLIYQLHEQTLNIKELQVRGMADTETT
jgi:hypothetical protein